MLDGILSISGQPGLYKVISQTKTGLIVESIETQKRIPAYATSKISALEDIAIFTDSGELPLMEVFESIHKKEDGGQAINHKADSKEIKSYFEEILPDYDQERVYTSDMKKVFAWYNLLNDQKILDFSEDKKEAKGAEEDEIK